MRGFEKEGKTEDKKGSEKEGKTEDKKGDKERDIRL